MSFFSSLLKRNEKAGGGDEAPVFIENGDALSTETGQSASTKTTGAIALARSPAPSPSGTPRGSAVGLSLASALKKITTGDLLTELQPSNHGVAAGTDEPDAGSKSPSVSVVIVGAGLAGLAAAHSLRCANQGISLLVLESSDRVGSRIVTRDLESSNGRDFWDLGAQWISGSQIHMMQLVDQLDLQMYTQTDAGTHLAHFDDGRKVAFEALTHPFSSMTKMDYTTFISKVEKLRLEVSLENPEDCPMAREWDSVTLEQFRKQHIWTASAQQYFDAQIKLVFGVPPSEMSTLFFLFVISSAGGWHSLFEMGSETAREFRIKGGTQRVCEILADKINRSYLKLGDPVVSINQSDSELVTVQTLSGKRYRCERVIVALPPKYTAKINFSPPMTMERDGLLQRMPSGNSLYFVVTYKEAFWQKQGFSGYVIRVTSSANKPPQSEAETTENGAGPQIPFTALFDATTMDQSPALSGKVEATKWRQIPIEERKAAILKGIEFYFGVEAMEPLDYAELDWGTESFCSSYPSCVFAPGAITGYFQALKTPFQRVHWAGEETTVRWFGFMDGAVYSGKRAAQEVLNELRPDVVVGV